MSPKPSLRWSETEAVGERGERLNLLRRDEAVDDVDVGPLGGERPQAAELLGELVAVDALDDERRAVVRA